MIETDYSNSRKEKTENEKRNDSHFHSCPNCYVFIIANKCSIINCLLKEWRVFIEKKQNGEKCTGTFTKRIGNTTYRVNVHFAENTTDTVEDKLLHLMGTVALTDEISSATDEAEAV